jgi:hypothetical protein
MRWDGLDFRLFVSLGRPVRIASFPLYLSRLQRHTVVCSLQLHERLLFSFHFLFFLPMQCDLKGSQVLQSPTYAKMQKWPCLAFHVGGCSLTMRLTITIMGAKEGFSCHLGIEMCPFLGGEGFVARERERDNARGMRRN